MTNKVTSIQASRDKVYGGYALNCKIRSTIMKALYDANSHSGNRALKTDEFIILNDIVNKLARFACAPDDEDSRLDLESYANLLNKYYEEN